MAYDNKDWEVQVVYNYNGKIQQNVVAFRASTAADDPINIGGQVYNGWAGTNGIWHYVSGEYDLHEVKVTRLDQGIVPLILLPSDFSGTTTGAESSPPVPPQVCAIIKLQTSTFGRKGRGRLYIPGVGVDHLTSPPSQWGSSDPLVTDLGGVFHTLVNDGSTTAGNLSVNSKKDQLLHEVISAIVPVYLGTQRRRAEAFE